MDAFPNQTRVVIRHAPRRVGLDKAWSFGGD